MIHRFRLVLLMLTFHFSSYAQPKMTIADLRYAIDTLFQHQQGDFAVAFKNINNGQTLFINEQVSFHAASTMKTPVLVEIFKQAKAGKFALTDSITLKNEFRSIVDSSIFSLTPDDDSDTDLYKHIGEKKTIASLMYLMITVSSNLATNLLIELVQALQVNETVQAMGATGVKVLRGVEDNKAYQKGLNNSITAYGLMVIFEKIAIGEAIDAKASQAMTGILMDQQYNEMIPAKLPAGTKVAHKTGWLKGVNHDSGIVFLPDGRKYVLVLLSKNAVDDKNSVRVLANVSGMIYKYLTQ